MNSKLLRTKQEAGNAVSFFFEPPYKDYAWQPGQYISCKLNDQTENDDNRHWFTISSTPPSGEIQITTRLTGSVFKNTLSALKIGNKVQISPAEGDFTWRNTEKKVVFVAGGIGITPYHSILNSFEAGYTTTSIHLIYVNRNTDIIYKEELDQLSTKFDNLEISYLSGPLNTEMLLKAEPNLLDSLVYLSGPEPMVEAVGNSLIEKGLEKESLIQDWFPGYDGNNF